jgi:hypothetical protein
MYCINTTGMTHINIKMFNWASEKSMKSALLKILQKRASSQPCQTRKLESPTKQRLTNFYASNVKSSMPKRQWFCNKNGKSQQLQYRLVAKMMMLYPYSKSKEGFSQFSRLIIPHCLWAGTAHLLHMEPVLMWFTNMRLMIRDKNTKQNKDKRIMISIY